MITALQRSRNPLVAGHTEGPGNFIDNEVKVYKLIDGVKTLVRIEKPYPEWWGGPISSTYTVTSEKSDKRRKSRHPKREAPPEAELRKVYTELGPAITNVAKRYGAAFATTRRWLREYDIVDRDNKPVRKAVQG